MKEEFKSIDHYIAVQPEDVKPKLEAIRKCIQDAAPEATEKISYQIPTFYLEGNLVHFAASKNHIGFYPGAAGVEEFLRLSSDCASSKGTIQFPITEEIPFDLVTKVVQFRVQQNLDKAATKKKRSDY